MDKYRKLELIQRSLGLRHKLKVHDSLSTPDNHEDLALMLLSRWDLEDELRAIEDILTESRLDNVNHKKSGLQREGIPFTREPLRKLTTDPLIGQKKLSTEYRS